MGDLWGLPALRRRFYLQIKEIEALPYGAHIMGRGSDKRRSLPLSVRSRDLFEAYCRFSRFEQIRYHNDTSVIMLIMMRMLMLKMLIMMVMMVFMMMMNMTLCSLMVSNVDHVLTFSWWTSLNRISESKKI